MTAVNDITDLTFQYKLKKTKRIIIQIPEQVKDAPIVRMKNAVLVGTMKFFA